MTAEDTRWLRRQVALVELRQGWTALYGRSAEDLYDMLHDDHGAVAQDARRPRHAAEPPAGSDRALVDGPGGAPNPMKPEVGGSRPPSPSTTHPTRRGRRRILPGIRASSRTPTVAGCPLPAVPLVWLAALLASAALGAADVFGAWA